MPQANLRVVQTNDVSLEVSGLCFASALAVQDVISRTNDGDINIIVKLKVARTGLTGNFDYAIPIPKEVNRVSFGEKRVPLWTRKLGVTWTNAVP